MFFKFIFMFFCLQSFSYALYKKFLAKGGLTNCVVQSQQNNWYKKKHLFFLYKTKSTSYVNYCSNSSQEKKYLFSFCKIKFTGYANYCSNSSQKEKYLYFFCKIKFTSYVNYCSKSSQKKSIYFIFLQNQIP